MPDPNQPGSHRAAWRSPIWRILAWHEISFRYRRSTLGPWWITITTGVFVVFVGMVYAGLLQQPPLEMLIYIAAGFILWQFFSACIADACSLFQNNRELLLNTQMTPLALLLRTFYFNLLILAHNLSVYLVLLVAYGGVSPLAFAMAPVGLVLFLAATFALMTIIAVLGARFLDVPAMVPPVLQILFLVTPIMWRVELLAEFGQWQDLNPLHHIIAVARDPLVGMMPSPLTLGVMTVGVAALALTALAVHRRYRAGLIYWL